MLPDDKEPKWWVTMLKLIVGAAIFIGLIGWALWYAQKLESEKPPPAEKPSWGIFSDSPLRSRN